MTLRSVFFFPIIFSLVSFRDKSLRKQSGLGRPLVVALAPPVLPDDHDLDEVADPELQLELGAGREILKPEQFKLGKLRQGAVVWWFACLALET